MLSLLLLHPHRKGQTRHGNSHPPAAWVPLPHHTPSPTWSGLNIRNHMKVYIRSNLHKHGLELFS